MAVQSKKQNSACSSLILRIFAVLLLLVMVSFHMLTGLLAKYAAAGEEGGGARVAVFNVNAEKKGDGNLTVRPDDSTDASYILTLTNKSEVAVRYSIVLTLSDPLPENSYVRIGENEPAVSDGGKTLTFANIGEMPSGISEKDVTLTFGMNNWNYNLPEKSTAAFEAAVTFTQID